MIATELKNSFKKIIFIAIENVRIVSVHNT